MKLSLLKVIINLVLTALFVITIFTARSAYAQSSGAFYTVQEGETLTQISQYFNTTTGRILSLNPMSDPNSLAPGKRLFVPGFEDLSGELVPIPLPLGDTVHSLNRTLHQGEDLTARLNFLTSPDEMYAGEPFFYLSAGGAEQTRLSLTSDINAAELAVQTQSNPWLAAEYNSLRGPWALLCNDTIFLPGILAATPDTFLPTLSGISVNTFTLSQGKTSVMQAVVAPGTTLSGSLLGYPLHFFTNKTGGVTALQGIPRMAEPGITTMFVTATTPDGRTFSHQQNLLLKKKDYGYDTPLEVADNVVDPEITEPEFALLMQIVADAPAEKLWASAFAHPSPNPDRITSKFGRLRSYNGSEYVYYHSGLDYSGTDQTPVLAPVPGIVVYTGELTVRGNATIISHGWGVYTGYWHQSRIDVKVGDRVETGQTIGMVGNTGRVTGPHLHFDLIVGGVEVDPEDWFKNWYADL